MHKKSRRQFLLHMLLMLFLLGMANGAEASLDSTNKLDSLRLSIQAAQDSLAQLQDAQSQMEREFQQINAQIYRYKQDKGAGNFIKNYRLQTALKTSRRMADQLEKNASEIEKIENELQSLYRVAVQQIDLEIHQYLKRGKTGSDEMNGVSIFDMVRKLEIEKADYAGNLKIIETNNRDWENLRVEPDDTPQRLQIKISILQDNVHNLMNAVEQQKTRIEELEKDRMVYREMLSFYSDLKLSVDEEDEFFDRDRIDELRDRVDDIELDIRNVEHTIDKMNADIHTLEYKIELFRLAANGNSKALNE